MNSVAASKEELGCSLTRRILVFAWSVLTVLGFLALWAYSAEPGTPGSPPPRWPSELERRAGTYTLVLFCHPQCPCTLSTIGELERILTIHSKRVEVIAFVVRPEGTPPQWEEGALLERLRLNPEVSIRLDEGGHLARRFRIHTSGEIALYAPEGLLTYSGGITESRAHEGNNLGRSCVEAILSGSRAETRLGPVYGCELFTAEGDTARLDSSRLALTNAGGCCGD